jgi:hypothetical protein
VSGIVPCRSLPTVPVFYTAYRFLNVYNKHITTVLVLGSAIWAKSLQNGNWVYTPTSTKCDNNGQYFIAALISRLRQAPEQPHNLTARHRSGRESDTCLMAQYVLQIQHNYITEHKNWDFHCGVSSGIGDTTTVFVAGGSLP